MAATKLGSQALCSRAVEMRECRAKINNHEDMIITQAVPLTQLAVVIANSCDISCKRALKKNKTAVQSCSLTCTKKQNPSP